MRIKKSIAVFLLIGSVFTSAAQQTINCEAVFAAYELNVKKLKYDDALAGLDELLKDCGRVDEKVYIYGDKVLNYKIEASRTDEQRKEYIDRLYNLYASYDKNFPGNKNANDVKKAFLSGKYKLASEDEVYTMYDAAFKNNRQNFTNPEALEAYFNLFLKRQEEGKKAMPQADFIAKNVAISAQVAYALNKFSDERNGLLVKQKSAMLTDDEKMILIENEKKEKVLSAIAKNINAQSSKYISCADLEGYYTEKFEANKSNADWVESLVNVMLDQKCYKSAVLQKAATVLYELKPNGRSAMYAAVVAQRNNKLTDAVKYYDVAAQFEQTPEGKADMFMKIASIYRNMDKAQAKTYAVKSAQANPKSGKPYVFLGEMYSSVTKECDLSDFERKALYWLAIETVKKAEKAEPKYKSTVAAIIGGYNEYVPAKSEAKAAKIKKGDLITYGCWINETLTVPSL